MSTTSSSEHLKLPGFDHYVKIGELCRRAAQPSTSAEATAELLRYRDEGLIIQRYEKGDRIMAKTKRKREATEPEPLTYSGRGIIFAVIEDREQMPEGNSTTIDVITEAIEAALDDGQETSEQIARYMTTSAFQHVPDKRVRFNSVLKAGDVVGAQIVRKLMNAYNDLAQLADDEEDAKTKAELKDEARGFAEAIQVVMSPFSCEDPKDPRLVNWDEIDRITANFEKEQRYVRRERKGNPQ